MEAMTKTKALIYEGILYVTSCRLASTEGKSFGKEKKD